MIFIGKTDIGWGSYQSGVLLRFLLHMQEQSSGNLLNTGLELIREYQVRNKFGSHGDDV